jgi:hypothetical protein
VTVGAYPPLGRIAGIEQREQQHRWHAFDADYRFSPSTIPGFTLAGGGTSFNVNGLGSDRSDLFQAGGYIRQHARIGDELGAAVEALGTQRIAEDVDGARRGASCHAWSNSTFQLHHTLRITWEKIANRRFNLSVQPKV